MQDIREYSCSLDVAGHFMTDQSCEATSRDDVLCTRYQHSIVCYLHVPCCCVFNIDPNRLTSSNCDVVCSGLSVAGKGYMQPELCGCRMFFSMRCVGKLFRHRTELFLLFWSWHLL